MAVSLSNIPQNKNVYRFITSGKPGNCKFCREFVEKLEAHHICYDPEIVIKLCHSCHHRVHFWPNRLSDREIFMMLKLRFHHKTAFKLLHEIKASPALLRKLVAPSKTKFIKSHPNISDRKHISKHKGVNKPPKALKKQRIRPGKALPHKLCLL